MTTNAFNKAQQSTRNVISEKSLMPFGLLVAGVSFAVAVTLWLSNIKEDVKVHETEIQNNCDQLKAVESRYDKRFDIFDAKLDSIMNAVNRKP